MKPAYRTRTEKRTLVKSIEYNFNGFRYLLNETLILYLIQRDSDQIELISPGRKFLEIGSFQKAKELADEFTEDVKKFCEKRLIASIPEEVIEDRFEIFVNNKTNTI